MRPASMVDEGRRPEGAGHAIGRKGAQVESGKMKKLFVGSLSFNTTDAALQEAFSRFGQITEAKVITDRATGRSRGFGFVSFEDSAAAQAAISAMNGTTLDGRTINVNEAQDKPRGDRGGDRGGRRW
jgi:RNA recognition motif-containing protein